MPDPRRPFENGEIIRLRYTNIRYLVTIARESARTGLPLGYTGIVLLTNDNKYIYFSDFEDYVIEI